MPRIARVVVPDVPYHVTQRGNYRQDVFEDDADKLIYLDFFTLYAKKHRLKIYAYCLMDNHVHFVVEPKDEKSLGLVFNHTHMRYSQYFNRKRGLTGHLWQGRFFSCPLDKEHLYEVIRYVELNPIRAGITQKLEEFAWSSARDHMLGIKSIPLSSIKKYLEIEDWKAYLSEVVNDDVLAAIRSKTKTGRPLGNSKFVAKLEKITGKSLSVLPQGRPKGKKVVGKEEKK